MNDITAIGTDKPNEDQNQIYRFLFQHFCDKLQTKGRLKNRIGCPAERKLLVFLLTFTGAAQPKDITNLQWARFLNHFIESGYEHTRWTELAKEVNKALRA